MKLILKNPYRNTGFLYDSITNDSLFHLGSYQVYRSLSSTLRTYVSNVSVVKENVMIKYDSNTSLSRSYTVYQGKITMVAGDDTIYAGALITSDGRLAITTYKKYKQDTANIAKYTIENTDNYKSETFSPLFSTPASGYDTFLLLRRNSGSKNFYDYVWNGSNSVGDGFVYIVFVRYELNRTIQTIKYNGRILDNQIKIGQPTLKGTEKLNTNEKVQGTSFSANTGGLKQIQTWDVVSNVSTINDIKDEFSSFPMTINAPSSVETRTLSLTWSSSIKITFNTTISDVPSITYKTYNDTTYSYYLKSNGGTYKLYVGKTFPNDFYSSFCVMQKRINEYLNQGEVVYKSSLSRSLLSTDIERPTINTTQVALTYINLDDPQVQINEPLTVNIANDLIKLYSDNNVFGLTLKTAYELGDVFFYSEILRNVNDYGRLYYTDGTYINISDYKEDFSITLTDSTLEDGTIISPTTPSSFTYKINFTSAVFGNYTYNASAVITQEELQVASAELVNYKNRFVYGDTINFGNNAQIVLKNASGDIIRTIPNNQIKTNLSIIDENYNKVINEENSQFLNDNEFTLESTLKDYNLEITQKFKVSYPKEASFNYSTVKKIQYWLPEEFDTFKFDLTGINVLIEYHDNTGSTTNIQNIEKQVEVENGIGLISNVNTKEYRIELSYTYEGRTFSNNGLVITAEKVRPVAIIIDNENAQENATSYWNTGEAFKYPNGFTFKIQYNAIKEDESINYNQLFYYYGGVRLTQGESIISQFDSVGNQNPTTIEVRYYYDNDNYLSGSFSISWRENSISSVDINSSTPIELTLGNSLNTLKEQFPIRITYSDTSFVDSYKDFSFVNGSTILMNAPSDIKVIVKENGENKEWTLSKNKYTFVKPKIREIALDTTNVSLISNNTIDGIDLTNLKVRVFYANAEFIGDIDTYKFLENQETLSSEEFSASNTTLGTNFHYDGTSTINLTFTEEQIEQSLPIIINVVNAFGDVEGDTIKSTTLNIKVVEITDITGLSIERVFEDYHIGDKFLDDTIETNENCTQVWVWYKGGNGSQKRILVDLRDSIKSLNIMPRPNTTFYASERNKTVRVSASTNPSVYVEYTINVEPKYIENDSTITTDIVAVLNTNNYTLPNGQVISDKYLLVNENDTYVENGIRRLNTNATFENIEVYGYLEDIGDRTKNARVILFKDYIPPIDGESNIVCEFPCYVKGNADKINKCTFGHLFGNNNAKNRLFVSGNPEIPNCDWHSGAINTSKQEGDVINENGDFTYFEDTSYCFYGQTDNKVVGYDIVSNDRLVVLKSKSDKEPTIYYRTSGLVQAVNGSGNNVVGLNNTALYEEQYPLSIGNIGTGAISHRAIINFNGDTLFMSSDKELDGLDITGIIGDSQRYAYSRSKYIDPKFKDIDLSKVWLWTNQKYLFLITDSEIYITHFETISSETKQYEWWRYDIKDVQNLIEIDEKIYFANSEGKLYTLSTDIYSDKEKIFIANGITSLASLDETSDTIQVAESVINQLDENKKYTFKVNARYDKENNIDYTSCLFYQIASINNSQTANNGNVDLFVNTEYNALEVIALRNGEFDSEVYAILINKIDDNILYFLNYYNNGNNDYSIGADSGSVFKSLYHPYYLRLVEDTPNASGLCFAIYDSETNERLNVRELYQANLVACLDKEYQITDVDKENATFKLLDQNEFKVDIVRYGDQNTLHQVSGELAIYENVKSYYISAPFTLGDLMYNKTIWAWTLTNDTNFDSYIEVCQATNNIDYENMSKLVALNVANGHDFTKFSFNKINFNKNAVPYKYTFIRPVLVPFICFGFKNNENSNAVLCSMQINYSKPSLSFGKGK